jgi:hypothetical protein
MRRVIVLPCGLHSYLRFIAALFLTLGAFSSVRAEDAAQTSIALVEVRGQTEAGPYIHFGTGFLVGPDGLLLTARHLVIPNSPWAKDDVTGTLRAAIYVTMRNKGVLADRRAAYVQKDDERNDVAVLKIDGTGFNIGLSTCPEPEYSGARSVVVRGFPASIDGSSVQSDNNFLVNMGGGLISDAGPQDNGRLRISIATRPGFSGAPVFVDDTVVGVLTGGSDGRLTAAPYTVFTPLRLLRGTMLGQCATPCRHSDNGIEKYGQGASWGADSGWRSGGSSPGEFCGAQLLARQRQYPDRKVNLINTSEDARWSGFMNRDREYRYTCSFRDDWDPVYKLALTSACEKLAGSSPLPR